MPTIVYVYGRPGCGKTQMLHDIFASRRVGFGKPFYVMYDFTRKDVKRLAQYFAALGHAADKLFVVVCSNLQPSAIPELPKDFVYCVDTPEQMNRARQFFNYVTA